MSSTPENIHVETERPDIHDIDTKRVSDLANAIMTKLGVGNWELSITFVSQRAIQKLNADFRNKDSVTDVLSFPQEDFESLPSLEQPLKSVEDEQGPPKALGDLIICPERAFEQSLDIGHSLSRETVFLMIHGILHLCGYDHQNEADERAMINQQKKMLALLMDEQETLMKQPLLSIQTKKGIT